MNIDFNKVKDDSIPEKEKELEKLKSSIANVDLFITK